MRHTRRRLVPRVTCPSFKHFCCQRDGSHGLHTSRSSAGVELFHVQDFVRIRSLPILVDASRRPPGCGRTCSAQIPETMEAPFIFQLRNAIPAWYPRSVIFESKHRRHDLVCCGLVNLAAFLFEVVGGQRTPSAVFYSSPLCKCHQSANEGGPLRRLDIGASTKHGKALLCLGSSTIRVAFDKSSHLAKAGAKVAAPKNQNSLQVLYYGEQNMASSIFHPDIIALEAAGTRTRPQPHSFFCLLKRVWHQCGKLVHSCNGRAGSAVSNESKSMSSWLPQSSSTPTNPASIPL